MERVKEKALWGLRVEMLCARTEIQPKGQEQVSGHLLLEPAAAAEEAGPEGRCQIGAD